MKTLTLIAILILTSQVQAKTFVCDSGDSLYGSNGIVLSANSDGTYAASYAVVSGDDELPHSSGEQVAAARMNCKFSELNPHIAYCEQKNGTEWTTVNIGYAEYQSLTGGKESRSSSVEVIISGSNLPGDGKVVRFGIRLASNGQPTSQICGFLPTK